MLHSNNCGWLVGLAGGQVLYVGQHHFFNRCFFLIFVYIISRKIAEKRSQVAYFLASGVLLGFKGI